MNRFINSIARKPGHAISCSGPCKYCGESSSALPVSAKSSVSTRPCGTTRSIRWPGFALPQSLVVFIGACEFLGGAGLILPAMTGVKPKLTSFAAIGLTLIMILAAIFHIVRGEVQTFSCPSIWCWEVSRRSSPYGRLMAMPIAARP